MDREKLNIWLVKYWVGEPISEKEKTEIRIWVGESEEHRKYYEELKRAYRCLCTQ